MHELGVPHGVRIFDPALRQFVLVGSFAEKGDVAQRRIAVLGETIGDQAEGAEVGIEGRCGLLIVVWLFSW